MKVEKVKFMLLAQDMERAVHFYEETFHFQISFSHYSFNYLIFVFFFPALL